MSVKKFFDMPNKLIPIVYLLASLVSLVTILTALRCTTSTRPKYKRKSSYDR